jgi:hypothetical protein
MPTAPTPTGFTATTNPAAILEKAFFYIDLPGEAVMDTDNLATIFCPKCGKEMKP